MALRVAEARAFTFKPRGLSDSTDATNNFKGAMQSLANLVPAQGTKNKFICRTASIQVTTFAGFTQPGFISCMVSIGSRAYGMIASGRFPGHDEPFCYDLDNNVFITISGVAAGNVPTSPSVSGDWVPPTIQAITSTKILVAHPGFSGANFFGTIDITTFATPAWSAGNTTTTALPSVPIAIAGFNGRAWFACGNALYFSDALVPGTISNASQVLILGDNTNITCLAPLGFESVTQGGIIQALIAFKGDVSIWQVTGDKATSNLTLNIIPSNAGTNAPNTVVNTPIGLAFVAPDGLRILDLVGHVSDPLGVYGDGVSVPFIYANFPTRMCAAFNQNVLRISCFNGFKPGNPAEEYWLDFNEKIWTGPHSFPSSLIQPYQSPTGVSTGHGFVHVASGINATLWKSGVNPESTDGYVENGVQLSFNFQPTLLPDNDNVSMNKVSFATVMCALPQNLNIGITAYDDQNNILDQISLPVLGTSQGIWDTSLWDAGYWGGISPLYLQRRLAWHHPLVFKQMSLSFSASSQSGFAIGNFYMEMQELGYMLQAP